MKPPPRLRLELRPSRIGCLALDSGCAAIAMLILVLPLDAWAMAAALLVVVGTAIHGRRRCSGRGVPALMFVGHDRRISVSTGDARSRDGTILDDSYVGARLAAIVWRPDGAPWYAPARTILVLPDSLPVDEFRRLRVMLRYGRPVAGEAASGVDAG